MKRLFDMDNPFWRALSVASDLLILNLLTLLCSLPIVTAGAAFTAMFSVVVRSVRGEEDYIVKPFFRAFKSNWKKGTLLWLLLLLAAGFLYFDYLAASAYLPAMRLPIAALAVMALAFAHYAFALLSRYENTLSGTVKNAATLAVGYFPRTLGIVVFTIAFWLASIHFYQIGAPLLLLFGFSLPCYVSILLMNSIFTKLENDEAS